jgi:hypothetical protein
MAKYYVKLTAPRGHVVPPLLQSFGEWLAKQKYGAVGWFELQASKVPKEWSPEATERLRRDGFCFLSLPEGSELVLLKTGTDSPPAVVLLGSEGDSSCVATSLEEFLLSLGQGETGIDDLDDEECEGREELRTWLKKNKVTAPKAASFDFDAYLTGPLPVPQPVPIATAPIPEVDAPHDIFAEIKATLGKPIDSPEVAAFLAKHPKHKVDRVSDGQQSVEAPSHGFALTFSPPDGSFTGRTKQQRVLTLGLTFADSFEQIIAKLGPPIRTGLRDNGDPQWAKWRIDDLVLHMDFKNDVPKPHAFIFMTAASAARFL